MAERKQTDRHDSASFAGSQIGGHVAQPFAQGADAMKSGMDLFRAAAGRLKNVDVAKKQGNLFEYIESAKYNANVATRGSSLRAHVTAAEGDPTSPYDILIRDGEKVVSRVQAKSYASDGKATYELSDPKYSDAEKLVPVDRAEHVRELAEKRAQTGNLKADDYAHTAENVTGQLEAGGVGSGGTAYHENVTAAENPRRYALKQELTRYGKEVAVTAGSAAVAAGIVGGVVSAAYQMMALTSGEATLGDASKTVAKDSTRAAVRGGASGGLGAAIRAGASRANIAPLKNASLAGALASAAVDACVVLLRYGKGELDGQQVSDELGRIGVSSSSGLYAGAVASLVFGPATALVASIGAYAAAVNIYTSCIALIRNAEMAEEARIRIVSLCEASIEALDGQEKRIRHGVSDFLAEQSMQFDACFRTIDGYSSGDAPGETAIALANLVGHFGKVLKLVNFEEFDMLMLDPATTLVI